MISDEEAINIATRIGVQARFEGLTKAQFENLLSSLDVVKDPKASLLVTAAYAHRQAARLGRGRRTATLISEALRKIYQEGEKEDARKLLGLAKWIFEIVENVRLPISPSSIGSMKFTDLIEQLK